ncbi:MAG: SOS response-associated peptidase [Henriciella sp.]|nr:SOS response-associated peptidase [Henriciella sp.]
MCTRFFRKAIGWQDYQAEIDLEPPPNVEPPEPTYNSAPMSIQPVLRWTRERTHIELAPCLWGLVPNWWTKPIHERKFTGFTADAATAHERPVYRGAFRYWRCLIPVSGYYVWTGRPKAKTAFAVGLRERHWFCLAGLWDTALINGSALESFTVLTTRPNDTVAGLAHTMPVIVRPEDYLRWLDPRSGDVTDLFEPFSAIDTHAWPVGAAVGNVRNNSPDLIAEV